MLSGPAQATIIVSSVLAVLATIVTALRFHARRVRCLALQADDFLILAALTLTVANCVLYVIGATVGGIGTHIEDLTHDELIRFGKILFALQFIYLGAVTLIKLSILSLYKRLFPTRRFAIAIHIMDTLVVLWFVAFFFATMFQALPLAYNWNHGEGTVINEYAMYTASAATEMLLDIATLLMPWPVIWILPMDTRRKLGVCGIFMLGGFVCVSSIVRLYYLVLYLNPSAEETEDITYDTANIIIWSAIEPCAGIICACLPILGPLFKSDAPASLISAIRNYFSLRSLYSKTSRSTLQAEKDNTSKQSYDSVPHLTISIPSARISMNKAGEYHTYSMKK